MQNRLRDLMYDMDGGSDLVHRLLFSFRNLSLNPSSRPVDESVE
jgi:hypothetical protein